MRFFVEQEKCTHCGACIEACPTDMIRERNGQLKISFVACIGCGHCLAICPAGAISLQEIEYEGEFRPAFQLNISPTQLLTLLQTRRTTRRFLPQPIPQERLEELLEAARWIPTAANCQCQQFVVITEPQKLSQLRQEIVAYYRQYAENLAQKNKDQSVESPMAAHIAAAVPAFVKNADAGRDRLFFEAPAVILIHADKNEVLPEAACAFAALAITLMAETMGLGTCISAYASMALQALPQLAQQVGVPKEHIVYYVVVVGYPAERFQQIPPRRPLDIKWL